MGFNLCYNLSTHAHTARAWQTAIGPVFFVCFVIGRCVLCVLENYSNFQSDTSYTYYKGHVDFFGEEGICANCMLKIVAASSNLPKKHLLHMLLERGVVIGN